MAVSITFEGEAENDTDPTIAGYAPTGSDLVSYVFVSHRQAGGTILGCAKGATDYTEVGTFSEDGDYTLIVFRLIAPSGTSEDVVVDVDGTHARNVCVALYTASGADQTTPERATDTDLGSDSAASVSVSSSTEDGLLIGSATVREASTTISGDVAEDGEVDGGGGGAPPRLDYGSGSGVAGTASGSVSYSQAASHAVWMASVQPAAAGGTTIDESLSDAATASDSTTESRDVGGTATDSATASDSVTQDRTAAASLSDTAQATDSVSVTIDAATITETLSDNAVAGDGALDVSRELGVSDAAEANDELANTRTSTEQATDAAQAADAVSGARGFTASLSDAAQAGDSVSEEVDPIADVTGQLIDPATAGDAAIGLTITRGESLSDAANAGDAVSATFTLAEALSDPAVASDAANLALVFTAALSDPAVAAGQVDIGRAWTETVSDPATGTDALSVSVVEPGAEVDLQPPFTAAWVDPQRAASWVDPLRDADWE